MQRAAPAPLSFEKENRYLILFCEFFLLLAFEVLGTN